MRMVLGRLADCALGLAERTIGCLRSPCERGPEGIDEEAVGLFVEPERGCLTATAHNPSGRAREPDQMLGRPAARTGGQLRHDPCREQELEAKCKAGRRARVCRVRREQREPVGEQAEHLGVWIAGLEQPRDRVAGARGGIERRGVVSYRGVGAERVRASDGEQVAAPFVQDHGDVEERLEPGSEATACPPCPLRDRADATVIGGVQVEDPVRLPVADRAQHDRFRPQRRGHTILCEAVPSVTIYTSEPCAYCSGAKALLKRRGIEYEEINLSMDPDGRAELARTTGMMTFPQIVIGDYTLGGFDELQVADHTGRLQKLLAA